jgi:hypothetical protein
VTYIDIVDPIPEQLKADPVAHAIALLAVAVDGLARRFDDFVVIHEGISAALGKIAQDGLDVDAGIFSAFRSIQREGLPVNVNGSADITVVRDDGLAVGE